MKYIPCSTVYFEGLYPLLKIIPVPAGGVGTETVTFPTSRGRDRENILLQHLFSTSHKDKPPKGKAKFKSK
eukprot:GDKH01020664.1.p4 GENE.GDKH01020664.1~~GDKH01020664.1.p4  ORF type:complete len:71 (+),score=3.11 GDKH01020664.1:369-581(+)